MTEHERLAAALTEALQDEYKARATYRQILRRFGQVQPFVNILNAEERHIRALDPLFHRYQIPIPADPGPGQVTIPDSLAAACAEGVTAELENGAMYDRLLAMTQAYPDVQRVFRNLQRASQQNHLRAFQRGVARGMRSATTPVTDRPLICGGGRVMGEGCGAQSCWGSRRVSPVLAKGGGRRYHGGRG
ncbi:ferritin-like domain-containing protein [Spirulina major]|uniref:ferritin-like domain-containing protein n=1 Tax=Spirulina major TaxID=270636 RepID=UPI001C3190BC|nr:DUF2202 domain-containing protein [Spirulina major]